MRRDHPRQVVLITGITGLLAPYVAQQATAFGDVVTTSRSGGDLQLDLTDRAAVARAITGLRPSLVIHAAALTDVDRCEREPDLADAANRLATAHLVEACPEGTRIVYISTDQVYPDTAGPHEEDLVDPVNVYGRTKLAGEHVVLAKEGSVVVRANFVGPSLTPGRESLSDFILDTLRRRRPITLFDDILFSPLHVSTLADLIMEIGAGEHVGVFNVAARDGMTKAAFGLDLAAHRGLSTDVAHVGSSSTHPDRAPRPRDLRMSVSRLERALGRTQPTVREEILKL